MKKKIQPILILFLFISSMIFYFSLFSNYGLTENSEAWEAWVNAGCYTTISDGDDGNNNDDGNSIAIPGFNLTIFIVLLGIVSIIRLARNKSKISLN